MFPAANYKTNRGLNVVNIARSPFPSVKAPTQNRIILDGSTDTSYGADGDPTLWQGAISSLVATLRASQTGRAVFDEIWAGVNHTVTIVPFNGIGDGAETDPDNWSDAMAVGAAAKIRGINYKGDGKGSNATVTFSPGPYALSAITLTPTFRQGALGIEIPSGYKISHPAPGGLAEDVLLHELVHATRMLAGILDLTSLPTSSLYDDEEELYAILTANIYASEKGRPWDLRANHHGHTPLVDNTDETFLPKIDNSDYRYRTVAKFVRTQPRLTGRLAQIHSAFNPIRRYHELQKFSSVFAVNAPWLRRL